MTDQTMYEWHTAREAGRGSKALINISLDKRMGTRCNVRDMQIRREREQAGMGGRKEVTRESEKGPVVLVNRSIWGERVLLGGVEFRDRGAWDWTRRQLEQLNAKVEAGMLWKSAKYLPVSVPLTSLDIQALDRTNNILFGR